jgi:hypothetical protein
MCLVILLVVLPPTLLCSQALPAIDRIEVGATFHIASYRYSGLVSPFLGGSARALAVWRYVDTGRIAVDGGLGAQTGAFSNLLGSGDVASTLVPMEAVQRTTVMFNGRYGISFALRLGTVAHLEPGWAPTLGFSIAAEVGNRIQLLPWLALDLTASAMHISPRGVDVSVLASHIGVTMLL